MLYRLRAFLLVFIISLLIHHVFTFSPCPTSSICSPALTSGSNILIQLKTGDDNDKDLFKEDGLLSTVDKNDRNALTSMLESLPETEKYGLLMQSISSKIIEDNDRVKNSSAFDRIEALYTEMITKSLKPSDKTSQQVINAACAFYDCNIIGKALSLVKRGGSGKAYGSGIGSLSEVSFDSQYSVELPSDNRKGEISAALLVVTGVVTYVSLQVSSIANSELHPWATLVGVVIILGVALDASFRKGVGLRDVSAGLQRLVLQDDEREEFVEASGLMIGYLLGLPCFAFQPDVTEAISMLRESRPAMDSYKIQNGKNPSPFYQAATLTKYEGNTEETIEALGRVLVWMNAPIAAETMKYGSTIIADPRKPKVLLDLFLSKQNDLADTIDENRKQKLLQWSYIESSTYLRRYGDILEEVRAYLQTKSSSAGECAMLLEERLS